MRLGVEDTHRLGTAQTHWSESREREVLEKTVKFVFVYLIWLFVTIDLLVHLCPDTVILMNNQEHKVGRDLESFAHFVMAPWTIL